MPLAAHLHRRSCQLSRIALLRLRPFLQIASFVVVTGSNRRSLISSAHQTHKMTLETAPTSSQLRPGLERIVPLLDRLQSPHRRFPVIHLAGTNAKGTTSSILDSVLSGLGFVTARFNSPHLRYQRDSCRIAGRIVEESTWAAAGAMVAEADAVEPTLHISPFEQLFAQFMVACVTSPSPPEILIVECGMGGALDATNVFPADNVLASVITAIGRDHKSFLGDSFGEITSHKMGIVKPNGLAVIADQRDSEGFRNQNLNNSKANAHLSLWNTENESSQIVGPHAAEVYITIREIASSLEARLVRCHLPFDVLVTDAAREESSDKQPWALKSRWRVALPPTLHSKTAKGVPQHDRETGVTLQDEVDETEALADDLQQIATAASTFEALPGQVPLATPMLPPLSPTLAVLSATSTALSALFAIASDEPPSARLVSGSDPHEDLRLRLAYGLQSEGLITRTSNPGCLSRGMDAAISQGIEGWEGRGSWVDVDLPEPTEEDVDQASSSAASSRLLHLFVDGAHNPPALAALLHHLCSMVQHHYKQKSTDPSGSRKLEITVLVSFSSSKATDGDLDSLLLQLAGLPSELSSHLGAESPSLSLRLAFLPFDTPIEGMPWVSPLDPTTVLERFNAIVSTPSKIEAHAFPSLQHALGWVVQSSQSKAVGRPAAIDCSEEFDTLVVLTGSLYLVGQLYREYLPHSA